jgi:aromatic-L-amino-acid decarboxylase
MSLDFDPEELRRILYKTSDAVVVIFKWMREWKVFQSGSPGDIRGLFSEPLPRDRAAFDDVLREINEKVVANSTMSINPRFLAYFTGGANQAAIPAEMIAAALNQNTAKWHIAPSATELERQVIRWICEFIGYPVTAGGCIISGGSQANFEGLAVARKVQPQRLGITDKKALSDLLIYVSSDGHSSIEKASEALGIGKDNVIKIQIRDDHTIDCKSLKEQIKVDREAGRVPFCVVGNAGTTNTGAVDPLDELAEICAEHKLWFHIDAAYGGPAAGSEKYGRLFKGLEKGDSLIIDPHKWFYAPFEAGCLLVKDPAHLRETFRLLPDYLRSDDKDNDERFDSMEYTFELTRSFKALKVWTAFKVYGAEALRKSIEADIEKIHYLAGLVDKSADFERLAPAQLSVACFRYRTLDKTKWTDEAYLDDLNKRILQAVEQDGRFFVTGTKIKGKTAIRVACINHRTIREDVETLVSVLREIGNKIAK